MGSSFFANSTVSPALQKSSKRWRPDVRCSGWRRLGRDLNEEDPRRGAATPHAGGRNPRVVGPAGRDQLPETCNLKDNRSKLRGRNGQRAFADGVAFDGTRTRGRREISASHQELFDKWLKGTRLTGRVLSIKFPSPDVALVHATGGTLMRGKTKTSPERDSIQTLVAVREGAEWRFAAFHNSRVRPIGSNAATFLLWAITERLWRTFAPGKKGS